ncbi:MAG: hypothetical protein OXG35_24700, partial [Acidobacteria bacterium]|nr:hypothetical protein [Acidobacteriota bacterium]
PGGRRLTSRRRTRLSGENRRRRDGRRWRTLRRPCMQHGPARASRRPEEHDDGGQRGEAAPDAQVLHDDVQVSLHVAPQQDNTDPYGLTRTYF